jgi:8-oxo-dGTP diphosphatase
VTQQLPTEQASIAAAIVVEDGRVLMVRRRIKEGELSWQFPAGAIESGESDEDAAVRETLEEAGLVVTPIKHLGGRVHPATGRTMVYVACGVLDGVAHVADPEELAEVDWCDRDRLHDHVPHSLFEPVQDYLDEHLA